MIGVDYVPLSLDLKVHQEHHTTVMTTMTNGVTHSEAPDSLRLSTIRKWPHYNGYGFNLHDEAGRPGHFIGTVEKDSPAEAAGLRSQDQIYEVNGESIRSDDHHKVINKVLQNPNHVEMLVGHQDVGEYYTQQGDWPHSQMAGVLTLSSGEHIANSSEHVVHKSEYIEGKAQVVGDDRICLMDAGNS